VKRPPVRRAYASERNPVFSGGIGGLNNPGKSA